MTITNTTFYRAYLGSLGVHCAFFAVLVAYNVFRVEQPISRPLVIELETPLPHGNIQNASVQSKKFFNAPKNVPESVSQPPSSSGLVRSLLAKAKVGPKLRLQSDASDNSSTGDVKRSAVGHRTLEKAVPYEKATYNGAGLTWDEVGTPDIKSIGGDGASSNVGQDLAGIRRAIAARYSQYRNCYERALSEDAGLSEHVEMIYSTGSEGRVEKTQALLAGEGSKVRRALRQCMENVSAGMKFPPSAHHGQFKFRFILRAN